MGFQSSYMPPPRFKPVPVAAVPRDRVAAPRDFLWLASPNSSATASHDTAMRILWQVAGKHGVPVEVIRGHTRARRVVAARHDAVCLIAVALPNWSLPQIGKFMGGRDHTSILYVLQKHGIRRPLVVLARAA